MPATGAELDEIWLVRHRMGFLRNVLERRSQRVVLKQPRNLEVNIASPYGVSAFGLVVVGIKTKGVLAARKLKPRRRRTTMVQ